MREQRGNEGRVSNNNFKHKGKRVVFEKGVGCKHILRYRKCVLQGKEVSVTDRFAYQQGNSNRASRTKEKKAGDNVRKAWRRV